MYQEKSALQLCWSYAATQLLGVSPFTPWLSYDLVCCKLCALRLCNQPNAVSSICQISQNFDSGLISESQLCTARAEKHSLDLGEDTVRGDGHKTCTVCST